MGQSDEDEYRIPEPPPSPEAESQSDSEEDSGGFSLSGPIGFGAHFPKLVAAESRWVIRAIAVSIIVLAAFYGWSLVK